MNFRSSDLQISKYQGQWTHQELNQELRFESQSRMTYMLEMCLQPVFERGIDPDSTTNRLATTHIIRFSTLGRSKTS